MTKQYFLAGDVGGTKTRLAIFEGHTGGKFKRLATQQYKSADYPNLQAIIALFLQSQNESVKTGCIGVPGPVHNGKVKVTNLPWELSESDIEEATGLSRLKLVNDLAATSAAIPSLGEDETTVIIPGQRDSGNGVAAVVAPGTGLGMGFLLRGASNTILPSEGGHARFAPADDREIALLSFLMTREDYVSNETLLCGSGIKNIFDFIFDRNKGDIPPDLHSELSGSDDPASVISRRALAGQDPICLETLEMFVAILASHCGNVAVTSMASGGIYLGGGIPPKIAPLLNHPLFRERFLARGKMSTYIKQIPVLLIKDDYAALTGAASLASEELGRL